MDINVTEVQERVFKPCSLAITNYKQEAESKEYNASSYTLNNSNVLCRTAKVTPKKIGQFVTFWKRNKSGIIEPFQENDAIDFYVIHCRTETNFGQFVFPKSVLIKKGIISTATKEGKRGFRVYPTWDVVLNKTALTTQKWQRNYFYEISNTIDFDKVKALYFEN